MLDQHKIEYQAITENLKRCMAVANDVSAFAMPVASPGKPDSVFDSALQRTQNLISNYVLSPTKTMSGLN